MQLRKLKKDEHLKTRKLWEQIFSEDTPEFLDYYYSVKTAENEIYVMEDDGVICAMLQLNPYKLQVGKNVVNGHYIVAVATDERYRRQGIMARLLKRAVNDMKNAGEPFTFLMPAAEAIYYPHGFRYIYEQQQGKITGKYAACEDLQVRKAKKKDCGRLSDFANEVIEKEYEVFARRDRHYYETLCEEQASENGGIMLVEKENRLVGCFMYAKGEAYEIREPLFLEGCKDTFANAVYVLTGNETTEVSCLAYGDEKKPMIMAKILDIPQMLRCMKAEQPVNLRLEVYDEPEEELLGSFWISGKEQLSVREFTTGLRAASVEEKAERITIGMLTSILFGYVDLDQQGLSVNLKNEIGKLKPLSRVFLNEIV